MQKYVVLDLETTGLSKHRHRITEIAALRIKDGEVVDKYEQLINPEMRIPSFITRLTGIDNEMVADAPTISQALPGFLDFLSNDMMIAHNATFDYGFIDHNASEVLGRGISNYRLCTRKLASRILPRLPSKKLSAICMHLGIENEEAHRAMADVKVTYQIFSHFLSILRKNSIMSAEELLRFERWPCSRCWRHLDSD